MTEPDNSLTFKNNLGTFNSPNPLEMMAVCQRGTAFCAKPLLRLYSSYQIFLPEASVGFESKGCGPQIEIQYFGGEKDKPQELCVLLLSSLWRVALDVILTVEHDTIHFRAETIGL